MLYILGFMGFTEVLMERKDLIERYIIAQMASRHDPDVAKLSEAIAMALSGGKRIRGFLVMEGARVGGIDPNDVVPTAAAVEAFHAYSLVHDDLPSMDNAKERRGRPPIHIQYDEATAILAGDTLIPLGFHWITEDQAKVCSPGAIVHVMQVFSCILGSEFLTGGQHLDLIGARNKKEQQEIIRRKTAGMIQASLVSGGILAELDEANLKILERFGENLGLAYQLVDDLIDWDEDGYDELMGIEEVRHLARTSTREAIEMLDELSELGERGDNLRELALYLAERTA